MLSLRPRTSRPPYCALSLEVKQPYELVDAYDEVRVVTEGVVYPKPATAATAGCRYWPLVFGQLDGAHEFQDFIVGEERCRQFEVSADQALEAGRCDGQVGR
jgi:hypothetical protein